MDGHMRKGGPCEFVCSKSFWQQADFLVLML